MEGRVPEYGSGLGSRLKSYGVARLVVVTFITSHFLYLLFFLIPALWRELVGAVFDPVAMRDLVPKGVIGFAFSALVPVMLKRYLETKVSGTIGVLATGVFFMWAWRPFYGILAGELALWQVIVSLWIVCPYVLCVAQVLWGIRPGWRVRPLEGLD